MKTLDSLRQEIDRIDAQLVSLFAQRMEVAARIAQEKTRQGLPVLDKAREEAVLRDRCAPLSPALRPYGARLFRHLMDSSKAWQEAQNPEASPTEATAASPEGSRPYGILGEKLGHSYSALIHTRFGYPYHKTEVAPAHLEDWVRSRALAGYNVTMPYKKAVMPLLDDLDPAAQALGAVNTVVDCAGRLRGYNTDAPGLALALQHAGLQLKDRTVVILGSGGAGTMAATLARLSGAHKVLTVSRQGPINYQNIHDLVTEPAVLLNATPCGMYPNGGQAPLSLQGFRSGILTGVFDLVYNPLFTTLILEAKSLGIPAQGGLGMLTAQAVLARDLFCQAAAGAPVPTLPTDSAFSQDLEALVARTTASLAKQVTNIVLIGMPGCGKTTLGRTLAQQTGKTLVDTDEVVVQTAGCPISELLAQKGEAAFRDLESRVLARVGAEKNQIISCGGGVVTRERNYTSLKQNGFICFLQTPLEALSRRNRPLSASPEAVAALWEARKEAYFRFADVIIEHDFRPALRQQYLPMMAGRIEHLYQHFCESFF